MDKFQIIRRLPYNSSTEKGKTYKVNHTFQTMVELIGTANTAEEAKKIAAKARKVAKNYKYNEIVYCINNSYCEELINT